MNGDTASVMPPHRTPDPNGSGEAERLRDLESRFVAHWSEMASAWGINRTMGEIHALLYIRGAALGADEIMEALHISRGNASMSLRALEDWGVIQRVRVPGNRREFFRSPGDVWQLFHAVVRERKRREFDPMVRSLRQFVKDAGDSPSDPALALYQTRVGALLGVLEVLDHIFERALPSDPKELPRVFEVTVEGLE